MLGSMSVNQNNNIQDLFISSCLNDLTNCYRLFNVDIMMFYRPISAMDHARKLKFSIYAQLPSINKMFLYLSDSIQCRDYYF